MLIKQAPKYHGFSMVELLIVLLLGSFLLVMITRLYVSEVSGGAKNLNMSRLRADLQSMMAMIETDIRRAGYGGSEYLVGLNGTKTIDINSAEDCIVYYYNHNRSATLENSNRMAFRLKDNSIRFKTGVSQLAEIACSVTTGWSNISDNEFLNITMLNFTEHVTSSANATMRSVDITLTGELSSDSDYYHSVSSHVQIRNMEFND